MSPFSRLPAIGSDATNRSNDSKAFTGANVHTLASTKSPESSGCSGGCKCGGGGNVAKKEPAAISKTKPVPPIKPKLQMPTFGGNQIRPSSCKTSKPQLPTPSNSVHSGPENKPPGHPGTRHVIVPFNKSSSSVSGNESSRSPVVAGSSGKPVQPISGYGDVRKRPEHLNKSKSVTSSSSVASMNNVRPTESTRPKSTNAYVAIKICVKLPNSTRQILTVDTSTTMREIVSMLQQRKMLVKNPEFATSDVPALRVSGKELATTTILDLGIENNSVLHCEEL